MFPEFSGLLFFVVYNLYTSIWYNLRPYVQLSVKRIGDMVQFAVYRHLWYC